MLEMNSPIGVKNKIAPTRKPRKRLLRSKQIDVYSVNNQKPNMTNPKKAPTKRLINIRSERKTHIYYKIE